MMVHCPAAAAASLAMHASSPCFVRAKQALIVCPRPHCIGIQQSALQCIVIHAQASSNHTSRSRPHNARRSVCRSVNNALTHYPAARRRNLLLHTPIIMAVWPQARIVQEEASLLTYGEVYDHNCARCNRDVDKPIFYYKERVFAANPDGSASAPFPPSFRWLRVSGRVALCALGARRCVPSTSMSLHAPSAPSKVWFATLALPMSQASMHY